MYSKYFILITIRIMSFLSTISPPPPFDDRRGEKTQDIHVSFQKFGRNASWWKLYGRFSRTTMLGSRFRKKNTQQS